MIRNTLPYDFLYLELSLEASHTLVSTDLVLLAKPCTVEVAMLKMSRALSSPRCVLKSQKMNGFPWETGYRSLWGLGQGQRQLHKELGM